MLLLAWKSLDNIGDDRNRMLVGFAPVSLVEKKRSTTRS